MAVSDDLTKQISDVIKGRASKRQELAAKLRSERGVDEKFKSLDAMRRSVLETEQLLNALPKDINTRTRGRGMTQAQVNRLLSSEKSPIAQSLADLAAQEQVSSVGIDRALSEINSVLGGYDEEQNMLYQDLANRRSAAWEKEARDAQNAINERLARMNAPQPVDYGAISKLLNPDMAKAQAYAELIAQNKKNYESGLGSSLGQFARNVQNKPGVATLSKLTGRVNSGLNTVNSLGKSYNKFNTIARKLNPFNKIKPF